MVLIFNKIKFKNKVLESDLCIAGFVSTVPKNEHSFLGGHDKKIEDAPLGYYRFHFWINSDTSKPHENFVFSGKHSGFICVSIVQDKDEQYRVLIRSAMVTSVTKICTNMFRVGKQF